MFTQIYDPTTRRWFYTSFTNNLNTSQYLFFRTDSLVLPIQEEYAPSDNNNSIFLEDKFVSSTLFKYKGFLVSDETEDYVDDKRYSEIKNDPINAVNNNLSDDDYLNLDVQVAELVQRIGNSRTSHKRKVEHYGVNNLSLEVLADISNLVGDTIQFLPPLPSDLTDPERIRLVTTDKGFVDYLKDNLQTIQNAGQKTIIWASENIPTGVEVTAENSDVKGVLLPDLEEQLNADLLALNLADEKLREFLTREGSWSVFNIPARSVIRMDETDTQLIRYKADFTAVVNSIILKSDGDIDMVATNVNITADKVNVI